MLKLDLPGLVSRADVIALGRARRAEARWASYGKLIVTDVEFSVLRPLKGRIGAGETVVITRMGGRLERIALTVPGEADLPLDRMALVFLRRVDDELRVVGMSQGVMPVTGSGDDSTVQPASGAHTVTRTGDEPTLPNAAEGPRALSAVLEEIASLVAGGSR